MLQLDTYYHIYNHANASENLFRSEHNFNYFLDKYHQHVRPIADTYAYCLMPNHFHFLVKIKDVATILNLPKEYPLLNPQGFRNPESFISQQFSNLFNAYTKAYNKMYARRGTLFLHNFKRKEVSTESYFAQLIYYIHANLVHHGFSKNIADWKYSSYHSYISERETNVKRQLGLEWFGGVNEFKKTHAEPIDQNLRLNLIE